MKKIALLLITLVGTLSMQAEDAYSYLTFETTDGTKISVPVSSLTISISGNTLTAGIIRANVRGKRTQKMNVRHERANKK